MLKPLISIIMPTYNTIELIERGINSVLNQTYKNIELIIINDGSTDGTRNLLDEISKKNSRVTVFHQENQGVSTARNTGLDLCSGEYICFLDSDDWLNEDAIYYLYTQIENKNTIISACTMNNAYIINDNIILEKQKNTNIETKYMSSRDALMKMGTGEMILQSSCYKLYPSFLVNHNDKIRFDTDIYNGEDGLFVFNVMKKAEGVVYSSVPKWNILTRENSATRKGYYSEMLTALTSVSRMIKSSNNNQQLQNQLKIYYTNRAIGLYIELSKSRKVNKEDVLILRKALRKYKGTLYKSDVTIKNKLKYFLCLFAPLRAVNILSRLYNQPIIKRI